MLRQFLFGGFISISNIVIHALIMTAVVRASQAAAAKAANTAQSTVDRCDGGDGFRSHGGPRVRNHCVVPGLRSLSMSSQTARITCISLL